MVLTRVEASQSGCAAATLGARRPVITTPVGGLVEQVTQEVNRLVADGVDAAAVARQIARIVNVPALYHGLVQVSAASSTAGECATFSTICWVLYRGRPTDCAPLQHDSGQGDRELQTGQPCACAKDGNEASLCKCRSRLAAGIFVRAQLINGKSMWI